MLCNLYYVQHGLIYSMGTLILGSKYTPTTVTEEDGVRLKWPPFFSYSWVVKLRVNLETGKFMAHRITNK